MSWLLEQVPDQKQLALQFKQLITSGTILSMPGAHDGLAARIAKQFQFEAIYLSGAAYTASRGLPDIGLIYSNEVADRARELIRAAGLPLLVDIDTGFGGVLNVIRTAKEMVEAGVAAVQIEDQDLPKKCGHLNGKKLITTEEMMLKIRAIKETSPTLIVVARTDAKGVDGMDAAIERAKQYVAAGADAIFPEALESVEEFKQFRSAIDVPLLANMTEFGKTPYYTADQFQAWGYNMVIYPVTTIRVAAKAYEQVFAEISRTGTQVQSVPHMQTRKQLYETIRYDDYEKLDSTIAKTVVPD
ncbi:methylisocitrate lyase [Paenibacillus albiflavus]|uniref:Methylisocitrate lyase n=1 Tax=Paenibacillus albiflavus TaxID=2545760 RepID=A0A4R4EB29_9BACL|nr:methylisocitrate lyase [Paenibacillus albiflavus]TCZ76507.1 methylisocitrate lyase [Paenibacillus albiflavus]